MKPQIASMKRQRCVDHGGAGAGASEEAPKVEGATMSVPSKKLKTRAVAKVKEEPVVIKVENVSVDGANDQKVDAQVAVAAAEEEESYSCNDGSVWLDEQMSWGSIWSPFWDVEFMTEAHYGLFSDNVVWDDDIWGLRTSTKEIPISNR